MHLICVGAQMAFEQKTNACLACSVLISTSAPQQVWVHTWHPNLKQIHVWHVVLLFSFKNDKDFAFI